MESPQVSQSPAHKRTSPISLSRLRIEGTYFRTADGKPFLWRGLSAFRLIELIAHGREADAIRLLDWAAERKISVVRAFVIAHHLFQLKPDEGLRALPRLLALAAARGLYVEVVAFADTKEIEIDVAGHMKAVASVVAAHDNAILEVANEPWHPTQDPYFHTPANVQKLACLIPSEVPVALGSAERAEGYAAGRYVTWHSPRASGRDGWQHVASLAEGASLVAKWQKPIVSDEPLGAGPTAIPGRRDDNPARFGAAGAVTRLAGLGATFHYEGGLQARIPAGPELASFEAWSAALDLLVDLPDGGRFVSGSEFEKIASIRDGRVAFGRDFGNEVWVLIVDPLDTASITWTGDWRLQTARNSPGIRLVHARR